MASHAERENAIQELASKFLASMLEDLVLDVTLQSHQEVARGRAICKTCNTQCCAVHVPGTSKNTPNTAPGAPRSDTPLQGDNSKAGTPGSSSSRLDGTLYFECVNCQRQIASTRYAPHLSSCLGLGSARRGTGRSNSNLKIKDAQDIGASLSPASENEMGTDEEKAKARSKSKRADEAEFNYKRKRVASGSPQVSPGKKKQKSTPSAVSRVKGNTDGSRGSVPPPLTTNGSQSKIPSKLRDSSTAPFLNSASPSSRSSSPATVASSSFSTSKHGKAKNPSPIPNKRPTPPRPPPVQHYTLDDGGDETGSSTDTDS